MTAGIRKLHLRAAIVLAALLPLLLAAALCFRHASTPRNSLQIPPSASSRHN